MVDDACRGWLGTPWSAGQACRGAGVDCVRFAVAVWDEVAERITAVPPLAQDASLHAGAPSAFAAVLRALDRTHGVRIVRPDPSGAARVRPCDLIITRVGSAGAAGHVYVVAGSHCYHACQRARRVVAAGLPASALITHIYRPSWAVEVC